MKSTIAQKYKRIIERGRRGIHVIVFGRSMILLIFFALQMLLLFGGVYELLQSHVWLLAVFVLLEAGMVMQILNSDGNPAIKLTWVITMALLPVFGTLFYFYTRVDFGYRFSRKQTAASFAAGREARAQDACGEGGVLPMPPSVRGLAHYLSVYDDAPVCAGSGAEYFSSGRAAFERMLQELEQAQHYIYMEYFILRPGKMWDALLAVLTRRAAAGVDVRLMYDGTCAFLSLPGRYPKDLDAIGIRTKVFSPLHPIVTTRYNNRDHRKICVIDGKVAFTGGYNLSDEYIGERVVYGQWKDAGLLVRAEAARHLAWMFLCMWNINERTRDFSAYLNTPRDTAVHDPEQGIVIPYGDIPTDVENVGEMVYLDIINKATKYVYIMTPYFIPDHELLTAICYAAKRGVDVRILLPHIPDKRYAFALARSHYPTLLDAGVKVYEYTPGFVHAKVMLSDDSIGVVGTINMDFRSLYLHYECAACLCGADALRDIRKDFDDTFAVSQRIEEAGLKRHGIFYRAAIALLRALAPLL